MSKFETEHDLHTYIENLERYKTAYNIAYALLDRFRNLSTNVAGEPDYEKLWADVDKFLSGEY